jgi:hypothetical protein
MVSSGFRARNGPAEWFDQTTNIGSKVENLPRCELELLEFGGVNLKNGRDMSLKNLKERTLGEFDLEMIGD